MAITADELRNKYLAFFKSKGHAIISGAPLIPEHDPTVLFTTAGMHPLVPYLLGEKHPAGKRLVDVQKCLRTDDIDEVGDFVHHTFFEMLGNWSLGDYFKKDAVAWSWEFLTSGEWLGLDKNKLAFSVFAGDADAPFDQEAYDAWRSLGVSEKRIARLPKKNNWWGPAGQTGPCGPDTEMFYWTGDARAIPESFDPDDPQWVEIWNDVFMQFDKKADGTYEPLQQQNVDTGMGLDRTLAVLNGKSDNYQTELFLPLIQEIEKLSQKKYGDSQETDRAMRIVADHARAATFLLAEGLEPSNVERGYILRRIIRRAVRYGKQLGIDTAFMHALTTVVTQQYGNTYPELKDNNGFITEQVTREEEKFAKALEKGIVELRKLWNKNGGKISGKDAFDVYQSSGLPKEFIKEYLQSFSSDVLQLVNKDISDNVKIKPLFDEAEFEKEFAHHQDLSRAGAEQKFKGGLADHSEQTTKYHTATHLLQAALRTVLGEHVQQKGSNITAERMRFDFPHPDPISPEQVKQVEDLVNEQIASALPVTMQELTMEQAKQNGALGWFASKYGERVKVYAIGDFSKEICGGPHVANTKDIGHFHIVKVESIGQGLKRIRAVVD